MAQQGITDPRHLRLLTEGALFRSVAERGAAPDLAILSDDAGRFSVLTHALCHSHAERVLAKLPGFNDPQREALASVRSVLWAIHDALKAYTEVPPPRPGDTADVPDQEATCARRAARLFHGKRPGALAHRPRIHGARPARLQADGRMNRVPTSAVRLLPPSAAGRLRALQETIPKPSERTLSRNLAS